MRAALYARVSTDEQAERYGLASQVTELRALAGRKGYTISTGAEFLDDGYSGADLDRPALTRLRDAARAGAFEVLLVHDPDRLSRRLAHQLLVLEEFERRGLRLEFLTMPREESPEGRLLLNVRAVVSEFEREKIRERTLRGKREKARRGLIVAGPTPFGYRRAPDEPGRLLPDDEQAAVVRMVFSWLVDEQRPIRSITAELRRLGIRAPRGRQWARSSVARLLSSEVYAGQAYFNRRQRVASLTTGRPGTSWRWRPSAEWFPIPVPALIGPAVFEQAQAQLARNRAMLKGHPPRRVYLLRGLLRCGACGRKLEGNPSHGRRVYRCAGRDRLAAARCGAHSRGAEALESFVWDTVVSVLRDPAVLTEKLEAHRAGLGAREVEVRSEIEHLARQVAEADRQEQKLLDLFLDERLDSPAVRERLADLRRRKAGLEERLARARAHTATQQAEDARHDAIRRFCRLAHSGARSTTA